MSNRAEKIQARVEAIDDRKIRLVIKNVKVSEIKPIMIFIKKMREKKSL